MTRPQSNRIRIAISQRRDATGPPHDEVRDALDHRLAGFVMAAGALPFPVPSALREADLAAWLAALAPGGIVLSGGADPGADVVRDGLEQSLIAHAERHDLPLLGLCRGMQVLAHVAGVSLVAVAGHVAQDHDLHGTITRRVNSYHGFAPERCPPGYDTLATAPDGTLEAIRHRTLPWEGWMWHPERRDTFDPEDLSAFRGVFRCAP